MLEMFSCILSCITFQTIAKQISENRSAMFEKIKKTWIHRTVEENLLTNNLNQELQKHIHMVNYQYFSNVRASKN